MSECEKEPENRSAIWSKHSFFLSHSCGLGRLKWMSYYEGGACACQSLQKGWTALYYWYCWGLHGPRETLSHSLPVDNFLMWERVHAAFRNRSARPPPLATSCEVSPLANSALFILHFFFWRSSRNYQRSALFVPLYHTVMFLGHCRWVGYASKFKAQDFLDYILNLHNLIKIQACVGGNKNPQMFIKCNLEIPKSCCFFIPADNNRIVWDKHNQRKHISFSIQFPFH